MPEGPVIFAHYLTWAIPFTLLLCSLARARLSGESGACETSYYDGSIRSVSRLWGGCSVRRKEDNW